RFTTAGKLILTANLWYNAIPTQNCDVLVTFPEKADDYDVMWIYNRITKRAPQLQVTVRRHANIPVYAFYITATFENLLQAAEQLSMRKRLKQSHGGGWKEFNLEESKMFLNIENSNDFFTTRERQTIVFKMVEEIRAEHGDSVGRLVLIEGEPIVPKCLSKGIIKQILPLHSNTDLKKLEKDWVQAFLRPQPLDEISSYFGVKIAMYFGWLGFYTRSLIIPAMIGLLFYLFDTGDALSQVIFAVFNIIWGTVFLEAWKRKSQEYAYRFGTLDLPNNLVTEPRPLYRGDYQPSPVTGRLEPYFPTWKRRLIYCVTIPVILFCISVVFVVMLLCFKLQEFFNEHAPAWTVHFPKMLLALSVSVMDDVYKKIAVKLNDWENYRLEETYENHLIVKLLLFQSVNSFLSLFYIAFYLQDFRRLKQQLVALLIVRQIIGNIKEALVPYVMQKIKFYRMSKKMEKLEQQLLEKHNKGGDETEVEDKTMLTQAEVECQMKEYEDTLEDYAEMFIQFGYVVLFSSAFPLAAVCALLNNVIEIRSDAFKLCSSFQRPFSQSVRGIGEWQFALESMGNVAVMVNCALLALSGIFQKIYPGITPVGVVMVTILLEHLVFAIKILVEKAIPDVPEWIETELAKLEYRRRTAYMVIILYTLIRIIYMVSCSSLTSLIDK
ncbi:uncharacterized protein TRIADDRAFT_22642, partial [Trichoplax adhaerens]